MRKNLKLRFQVDIPDSHLLFQISFVIFWRQLDRDNLRGNILFDDIPAQFVIGSVTNILQSRINVAPEVAVVRVDGIVLMYADGLVRYDSVLEIPMI